MIWIGFFVPGDGTFLDIVLCSMERGWGIQNFAQQPQVWDEDSSLSSANNVSGTQKANTHFPAAKFIR